MKNSVWIPRTYCTAIVLFVGAFATLAQVPQLLNYQGRVAVNGTNFTGIGQFRFALVDGGSNGLFNTFWSNDGSSSSGAQPANSVSVAVNKGLFTVLLGDSTLSNMVPVPASVFTNSTVNLRIWFSDGTNGIQQLTPYQQLTSVGYAMMANYAVNVPDGSITSAKIAPGSIGAAQLAAGSSSSLMTLQLPGCTNVQANVNSTYVFTNAAANRLILPANPNVGDRIRMAGGPGGFTLIANTGQSVYSLSSFTWTARGAMDRYSVASSCDGSKLVVVQFGGGILTSSDYGMTWTQQTSSGLSGWECVGSSSDGSRLVAGQQTGNLFSSTNFGVNWVPLSSIGLGVWFSIASSADGSTLLVGGNHEYVSQDYGATWSFNVNNLANEPGGNYAAMSVDGGVLFDDTIISTNEGATWTYYAAGFPSETASVACSSDGTKVLAGQNNGYLYTSTDSGMTWNSVYADGSGNWQCVAVSGDGKTLAAGQTGGYLYTSPDFGNTWVQQTAAGVGNWSSLALSSDGSRLIAGQNGGYYYVKPTYLTASSTKYVYGSAYANLELVYMGAGLWVPASCTGNFSIQ